MLEYLKRIYCAYVTRIFFKSATITDLNKKLDKIINFKMESSISGDADLSTAIKYVISYRKYERHICSQPSIQNLTFLRVIYKSLFA